MITLRDMESAFPFGEALSYLLITLVLLVAFPVSGKADWFEPLTKRDIILEGTWQGIHILDWGTTLGISSNPREFHEMNPIIGRHPSRGRVNLYMSLSSLLHMGVTYALPRTYRPYFHALTIMTSTYCVVNNFSIGLSMDF